MKRLMVFTLFICAMLAFAFLPLYAFYITDDAIYSTPLPRTSQWPPLSAEGEDNLFASTMFSRKNIYGARFLRWEESPMAKKDAAELFLSKLKELCAAQVLDNELYQELEQAVNDPKATVVCFTDAMDFICLRATYKDTLMTSTMEINTTTNTVYSLVLAANAQQDAYLDRFLAYLDLDEFDDWAKLKPDTTAYSPKAQLYVYMQMNVDGGITLGVFPMTQADYEAFV